MLEHEYNTMRRVEDDYWWYRTLRTVTCREVAACTSGMPQPHILDAGCGTGGMMEALQEFHPNWVLQGFDFSTLAVNYTRERGFARTLQGSVENVPFENCSQDVVISLDVLCCGGLDQDRGMNEFHRVLRKGGFLIMNLPAYDCLRGSHDFAVNSVRRYTHGRIRELHRRHGFDLLRVFCWNAWLFPPVFLWRQISKRLPSAQTSETTSDLVMPPIWLNSMVAGVAKIDAALCRNFHSLIGTSVFSVARIAR